MKDLKQFIQITDGLAEPLRQGFLRTIDDYEKRLARMSKEAAIVFAKKYLADRRDSYVIPEKCKICGELFIDYHIHDADTPSGTTTRENKSAKAWDVAVEYILEDIIPYLYGEALD